MHKGESYVSVTKRLFWPMFKKAWDASFTKENIESGWRKTGIWPFHPSVVLSKIKRPSTPPNPQLDHEIKTPLTVKGLRRFQKSCLQQPTQVKLKKLLRANETLLARTAIAEHRARNLQEALQIEKKKRQRGKRLNLAGKETSHGQWWGVPEIQIAKAKLAERTALEEQEQLRKEQQKVEKEIKRREKEQEKAAKALQRDINRQVKEQEKAEKARKTIEARAVKAANKKPPKARKIAKKTGIVVLKLKKAAIRSLALNTDV
jgi:hypothetical protein